MLIRLKLCIKSDFRGSGSNLHLNGFGYGTDSFVTVPVPDSNPYGNPINFNSNHNKNFKSNRVLPSRKRYSTDFFLIFVLHQLFRGHLMQSGRFDDDHYLCRGSNRMIDV